MTALHLAAQFSSSPVVSALLEAGADVKALDSEQRSPLQLSVKHNEDADVVKVLVASGADVKVLDNKQQTLLHHDQNWELLLRHFSIFFCLQQTKHKRNG